jgi:predicted RNase H-like HicB family nuclease
MKQYKIIVEKHFDGYVAYPLGFKGVVVGEGETYEEALADVKSAISFHINTFGKDAFDIDPPILEAFVAETGV